MNSRKKLSIIHLMLDDLDHLGVRYVHLVFLRGTGTVSLPAAARGRSCAARKQPKCGRWKPCGTPGPSSVGMPGQLGGLWFFPSGFLFDHDLTDLRPKPIDDHR